MQNCPSGVMPPCCTTLYCLRLRTLLGHFGISPECVQLVPAKVKKCGWLKIGANQNLVLTWLSPNAASFLAC